jgi:beta-glucosidase
MRLRSTAPVLPFLFNALWAVAQANTPAPLPPPTEGQVKAAAAMPFRNPGLSIDQRVDDLVGRMTLD